MSTSTVKEEARRLVDRLPENATWEDVQYEVYVRQAFEAGLKDSREGRTVPLAEACRLLSLASERSGSAQTGRAMLDGGGFSLVE
jgi:hypothetical protein